MCGGIHICRGMNQIPGFDISSLPECRSHPIQVFISFEWISFQHHRFSSWFLKKNQIWKEKIANWLFGILWHEILSSPILNQHLTQSSVIMFVIFLYASEVSLFLCDISLNLITRSIYSEWFWACSVFLTLEFRIPPILFHIYFFLTLILSLLSLS